MPIPRGDFHQRLARLREQEVGRTTAVETPFGQRLLCYADMTASGKFIRFVETFVGQIQPYYANTHTAISSTGSSMTRLREDARAAIARGVHAGPDDVVVFAGSGATAAVNKLVGLLGLRIGEPLEREHRLSRHLPDAQRPVVFVGPYEHHSNLLPWLESVAQVVEVGLDADGRIDLADLERRLREHQARPLKVGTFSAASNVTGVLTDVGAVARVLHRHGAYACFDFAAAGPYVPLDMNPPDPELRLDAVFLSMHKFVGGPGASGVLVANRSLFRSAVPERPGGGTVDFVAAADHSWVDYVPRLEEREEGGTPDILGDIRAGIAFVLRESLGPARILEHELAIAVKAVSRLSRDPRVQLLGPIAVPRLAILSLNIEGLHHDLFATLLDHLFGIQSRAGCSCAGPYGRRLLGIDEARATRFRRLLARGVQGIKPGWVRLSLPYYASDADVEFILRAVEFIADRGRDFVPAYRLGWRDGIWRHLDFLPPPAAPFQLTAEALEACAMGPPRDGAEPTLTEAQLARERERYLAEAEAAAGALRRRWAEAPPKWNPPSGDPEVDALRWFDVVHADGVPESREIAGARHTAPERNVA